MYTKCFGTLVCCVWAYGATLTVIPPLQVGGGFWDYGGRPEPVWYCYVMVEATTGFRLDPTSILDVYKMFSHLDMLCRCSMGIWDHPYRCTPLCRSRVDFGVLGVDLSPWCCNVMVEATTGFRLDPAFILYWMYTKCFGTLICWVWAFGATLPVIRLCRSGVDFGFWGVDLSPCNVVMSWMRLQQASDWIPHPYWMYTKCFGTLICCVWAYGATLTAVSLCRSRVDFGVLGVADLSPCDMLWCHCWGFNRLQTKSHIWIGCIQSVLVLGTLILRCVWAYGATL